MAERYSPLAKLFASILMLFGILLFFAGLLLSLPICIDRMEEMSNGFQYRNNWVPFRGHYTDYLFQLPKALMTGIRFLPGITALTVLFYPLIIVLLPLFDLFRYGDFSLVIVGWLPMIGGAILFVIGGVVRSS